MISGMEDTGSVKFNFTFDPKELHGLRSLLGEPPQTFELRLEDGTLVGVNGRSVGDRVEFDLPPVDGERQ